MDIPTTYDGAIGSDNTAAVGIRVTASGNRYVFGATTDDGYELIMQNGLMRPYIGTVSGDIGGNGTTNTTNNDVILSTEWDRSEGSLKGWYNLTQEVNLTGTAADKSNGAAAWLGQGFSATAAYFSGRMYGVTIYDAQLSDYNRVTSELYLADKSGVSL